MKTYTYSSVLLYVTVYILYPVGVRWVFDRLPHGFIKGATGMRGGLVSTRKALNKSAKREQRLSLMKVAFGKDLRYSFDHSTSLPFDFARPI